jgi:hypothetical protein
MLDAGTLYLLIGAALIFGACAYAAKRILRQLTLKQIGASALIAVVTLGFIWGFLALGTRKPEPNNPGPEISEPTPPLQPSPE